MAASSGIAPGFRARAPVRGWVAVASAVLLGAGLSPAIGYPAPLVPRSRRAAALAAPACGPASAGEAVSFLNGFAAMVKRDAPAVVNVLSTRIVPAAAESAPAPDEPNAPSPAPGERREASLGSGVIVRPDGYILTNNHVIANPDNVRVQLGDQREFKARVLGTDPPTDVAVLKIDAHDLPTLPLGDSSQVQVGDVVLAIGDSFGIGQTVTMGIISAIGRGNLGIEDYEDFLQTDAAINPGNSGGALVDVNGRMIGVNTAILTRGVSGNQGIGFAIPINMARAVMDQIIRTGKVVRGWLGAGIQNVTPALARAFSVSQDRGALLSRIMPNSPAAAAGLARGDIVTALNGQPIRDSRTLRVAIAGTAPGTTVRLTLIRDGREREVQVTLGTLPVASRQSGEGSPLRGPLAGVTVEDVTPRTAGEFNLPPETRGVVVTGVKPDSAAAEAGLQRGDAIVEANHQPVTGMTDFERAIHQPSRGVLLLLVDRGAGSLYIAIEPGE